MTRRSSMPSSPGNDDRHEPSADGEERDLTCELAQMEDWFKRAAPVQQGDGEERDFPAALSQMEDRFKRAAADLDNYRKRAARDLERLVRERSDAALLEWIEVVDGVDRALAQKPDNPLRDGL